MECGKLLMPKWKIGALLRKDGKSLRRGGEKMSEVFNLAVGLCKGVTEGKVPIDTAKEAHLSLHRAVWDRVQDDKEARRIGEEAHNAKIAKSVEMVKGL
jgi:hypothetical protein